MKKLKKKSSPMLTVVIGVRLPVELGEKLKSMAAQELRTESNMATVLVTEAIEARAKNEKS